MNEQTHVSNDTQLLQPLQEALAAVVNNGMDKVERDNPGFKKYLERDLFSGALSLRVVIDYDVPFRISVQGVRGEDMTELFSALLEVPPEKMD